MRRITLALIMFFTVAVSLNAAAQEKIHRNIGLDSLMAVMQRHTPQKVYYQSDESAKNLTFTVNEESASMLEEIGKDLKEKGYVVMQLRGYLFVLKGIGLSEKLPYDYFSTARKQEEKPVAKDYIDAIAGTMNVATSGNKTYQIGDKDNIKSSGKAYLSGYVRDAVTGEPVVGVALIDNTTRSFAQSDAHGFYKILLPVGKTSLDVSGYSLEDRKSVV